MDFVGQRTCERLYQLIVILFAVLGFVSGFIAQSMKLLMYIFGSGVLVACVVCGPDWPIYNKNPIIWRDQQQRQSKKKGKQVTSEQNSVTVASRTKSS
mmetsp:Transcript_30216/g.48791  ORF Transcript_30216/g.48791 Transcript_30216/m.48791 type:complete len:98 (-) Transcript_30216:57-350(-)